MEKTKADAIISEYLQKIYGFAYKKSFSYDEAEEIASEMTVEVYRSLLSSDEVINIDGYIWRICEHTYAKYVASVKRNEGISIDGVADMPYYESAFDDPIAEEADRIRLEIAYLSSERRQIVFRFYYKNESIRSIASRLNIPEGTVKWHLNKARNELKEGYTMERKVGKLGIDPVKAGSLGHCGFVGPNGGPEYYLGDKLNLNIVYSVYYEPKNLVEISEELGVTPVFIEDKVKLLENNGYLVKNKDGRYTTFAYISPRTYSKEQTDNELKKKFEAAEKLVNEYVPLVRKAVEDVECYIPGGNRQLLEAAAVCYGIENKCSVNNTGIDLEKYKIKDLDGGEYIPLVDIERECVDPDYKTVFNGDYSTCGDMWRSTDLYHVQSWSIDSRFDSRKGYWKNNLISDYVYLYEYMTGKITDNYEGREKIKRLEEREFIGDDGKVQVMVCKGDNRGLFDRIPSLDEKSKERFAAMGLEIAMQEAKNYPPQMQDLAISRNSDFIDHTVAMMALDILYGNGTFDKLTEKERITANLIMFSDVLPKE